MDLVQLLNPVVMEDAEEEDPNNGVGED